MHELEPDTVVAALPADRPGPSRRRALLVALSAGIVLTGAVTAVVAHDDAPPARATLAAGTPAGASSEPAAPVAQAAEGPTADDGTTTTTSVGQSTQHPISPIVHGDRFEGDMDIVIVPPTPQPCAPKPTGLQDGLIAFSVGGADSTDLVPTTDIAVMSSDGTGRRVVIRGGGHPAWSPDGARLAYEKGSPSAIYVADADGTHERLIARGTIPSSDPAWSPTGEQLVFVQGDANGESDLYVVDADGSHPRRLTGAPGYERTPTWSPDGSAIAYEEAEGQGGVTLIQPDGSGRRDIAGSVMANDPQWSPDGSCLSFTSSTEEATADGFWMSRISTAAANGEGPVQLTPSNTKYPEHDFEATWSPSGRSLVFSSGRSPAAGTYAEGIWVMAADGSAMHRIADLGWDPSWRQAG